MEEKKEYLGNFDKNSTRVLLVLGYPLFLIFAIGYGVFNGINQFHKSLKFYF